MKKWIVIVAALLFTSSAYAQDGMEKQAMAFCDGMATALTTANEDCVVMGKNLEAHVVKSRPFLISTAGKLDNNKVVADYCQKKLEPAFQFLAKCSQAPEMMNALKLMSEIEAEAKKNAPAPKPVEAVVAPPLPADINPALLDPSKAVETAPASFKVRFTTTEGDIVIEVTRAWAPKGADRIFNLVKIGYFNDIAFFRAIEGFMIQFGIHGHPQISAAWKMANIEDDPVTQSNTLGMVTFATAGPNTRTTQFFINVGDNNRLDGMGFAPFGKVVEGMDIVGKLHTGYGEGAPRGRGPDQGRIQTEGNGYLQGGFPELDYIKGAKIE